MKDESEEKVFRKMVAVSVSLLLSQEELLSPDGGSITGWEKLSGNSHSEAALEVPRFLGEECTWLEPAFQMLGLDPETSHGGGMCCEHPSARSGLGPCLRACKGKAPGRVVARRQG